MKKILSSLALFLVITSCSENKPNEVTQEPVQLRLTNTTDADFEDVVLRDRFVGFLASGESSDFYTFDMAYRYGYVEALVNGEKFTIQPIDFVGEFPLNPGKYAYRLFFNEEDDTGPYLDLSFEVLPPDTE
ncbi:MAG: hypothetical protein AAF554_04480 [Bacteroidota bacterium]